MRKDNKGYSLIELLIVLAIMAVLAALGMVTFNSANRQRPAKAKDNLVSSAKYAKSLVQAQSADYCVAIIKSSNSTEGYYAVIGTAAGTSQTDLRSSFRSEYVVTVDNGGVKTKQHDTSKEYTLSELIDDPTKAQNSQSLGNRVEIKYEGSEIEDTANSAIIIKFSKFDGSVVAGAGQYDFYQPGKSQAVSSVILNLHTGNFRKNN